MNRIENWKILRLQILKRTKGSAIITKKDKLQNLERIEMSVKFRPFLLSPKYRLKYWLQFKKHINYNFIDRKKNYTLSSFPRAYKIGGHLHYLASHAPLSVRKKWKPAFRRFCQKYKKF
jgi:hypothetical protein